MLTRCSIISQLSPETRQSSAIQLARTCSHPIHNTYSFYLLLFEDLESSFEPGVTPNRGGTEDLASFQRQTRTSPTVAGTKAAVCNTYSCSGRIGLRDSSERTVAECHNAGVYKALTLITQGPFINTEYRESKDNRLYWEDQRVEGLGLVSFLAGQGTYPSQRQRGQEIGPVHCHLELPRKSDALPPRGIHC